MDWQTWVFSDKLSDSHSCASLQNYVVKPLPCETLLPFLCEKSSIFYDLFSNDSKNNFLVVFQLVLFYRLFNFEILFNSSSNQQIPKFFILNLSTAPFIEPRMDPLPVILAAVISACILLFVILPLCCLGSIKSFQRKEEKHERKEILRQSFRLVGFEMKSNRGSVTTCNLVNNQVTFDEKQAIEEAFNSWRNFSYFDIN